MSSLSQSFTGSSYPTASRGSATSGRGDTGSSQPRGENFFDLGDILASQQKVPCQFEQPVYRLGYLNPHSTDEHIGAGTKMELPLWLARALGGRRRNIVKVELPKQYREQQRNILGADANVVDLYRQGPYFYSMGLKMLFFDHLERSEVARSLIETFLNRFRRIMDTSRHAFSSDITPLTTRLDETERALFRTGQRSVVAMEKWERGRSHKMEASEAVKNRRKRKRDDEE